MLQKHAHSKPSNQTAASHIVQRKSVSQKGRYLNDQRSHTNNSVIQQQSKGHGNGCGCASCSGTTQLKVKKVAHRTQNIAQLKCDDGHPQHKKGPCPNTPEGKHARMQGKHGGGKPHGKKAKARPKKRQKDYDQSSLDEVRRRFGGNGGNGGGAGGAGGGIAAN